MLLALYVFLWFEFSLNLGILIFYVSIFIDLQLCHIYEYSEYSGDYQNNDKYSQVIETCTLF